MVKFFSWSIVGCLLFYILGSILLPFLDVFLLPIFFLLVIGIAALCAVGLIITLIIERLKDRKEEKDDLSKY